MLIKWKLKLDMERVFILDPEARSYIYKNVGRKINDPNFFPLNASDIRMVAYALLKKDDPKLTLERVGELVNLSTVSTVMDGVNHLILKDLWRSGSVTFAKTKRTRKPSYVHGRS